MNLTLIMADVSTISAMKVESPLICESSAPNLANMASSKEIVACSQGTKLPICAINAETPIDLMYVLLPPMFGPVTI